MRHTVDQRVYDFEEVIDIWHSYKQQYSDCKQRVSDKDQILARIILQQQTGPATHAQLQQTRVSTDEKGRREGGGCASCLTSM